MTTPITHTDDISLSSRVKLKKVIFVPNFHYNFLSVSKFCKDNNVTVLFFPHFCLFQDLWTGSMISIGKEYHGLYYLVKTQDNNMSSSVVDNKSDYSSSMNACTSVTYSV
ncbi:hypothetical protein Patl1_05210 [Pistacia atlantica]|uniref:Uncharacterized protein n=1 Tax=Pistacia atlantica TaxID=434234 RepID=A0ACC1BTQ1_9ROSI|nr:hypothetical protein Patl1_05210 [Pistacia atlantica]